MCAVWGLVSNSSVWSHFLTFRQRNGWFRDLRNTVQTRGSSFFFFYFSPQNLKIGNIKLPGPPGGRQIRARPSEWRWVGIRIVSTLMARLLECMFLQEQEFEKIWPLSLLTGMPWDHWSHSFQCVHATVCQGKLSAGAARYPASLLFW